MDVLLIASEARTYWTSPEAHHNRVRGQRARSLALLGMRIAFDSRPPDRLPILPLPNVHFRSNIAFSKSGYDTRHHG